MLVRDLIQQCKKQVPEQDWHENDIYALLGAVLKVDKLHLFTLLNRAIHDQEIAEFQLLWARYLQKEPLQYILGSTYFYGFSFRVNDKVLIPRLDSEILVDTILQENDNRPIKVVDLGTGSGNLAITLKKHRPNWQITAIDNSLAALEIAKINAHHHQVEVQFMHQDMLEHLLQHPSSYDLIVCNPPYIDVNDPTVEHQVRNYEPANALFAPEAGFYYYHKILDLHLRSTLYFEIGYQQKDAIMEYSKEYTYTVYRDLSGHNRVLKAQLKTNNF